MITTEKRQVLAIEVRIEAPQHRAAIVWPDHNPAKPCITLQNPFKQSWLDVKAGDKVLSWSVTRRRWIDERAQHITLFRVFPVTYNGLIVPSAREWLEGVNGIHKSKLSVEVGPIHCDKRGYVPTQDTGPFDLQ